MTPIQDTLQDNMPKKRKSWLSFTGKLMERLRTWRQKQQNPQEFSRWNLYHTCNDLPLDRFIDCLVEGNLNSLVIDGHPPVAIIHSAWESIFEEYLGLMKTSEMDYLVKLVKEINMLRLKLTYVQSAVRVLSHRHIPEICKELRKMGFDLSFDKSNPLGYSRDLQSVVSRSKTMIVQLKQKDQEYETYMKKSQGKSKGRADYDAELVVLSKYQGYRIDKKVITVAEYCSICKSFTDSVELQHKKNLSNGSTGRRVNK